MLVFELWIQTNCEKFPSAKEFVPANEGQAAAEIDVQHEPDGHVSVHQGVPRHGGANISGQRQIAVLD